jgi:hypothetical protein
MIVPTRMRAVRGVAVLCSAMLVLTRYHQLLAHAAHVSSGPVRPLAEIVRQPSYLVAVLAGIVSYAVMSFIMTATPISMHVHDHHSDAATAWVIQSHLLECVPSLFSGVLISRGSGACRYTSGSRPRSRGRHRQRRAGPHTTGGTRTARCGLEPGVRRHRPAHHDGRARAHRAQATTVLIGDPGRVTVRRARTMFGWETLNLAALPLMLLLGLALVVWPVQRSRNSRA